jgi:hypothetical protein
LNSGKEENFFSKFTVSNTLKVTYISAEQKNLLSLYIRAEECEQFIKKLVHATLWKQNIKEKTNY